MKIKTMSYTQTNTTMSFGGEYLKQLLKKSIPENATDVKIIFEVPRGGDYSGMELDLLDIGMQGCITVSFVLAQEMSDENT
jgi:hypothetical protein